MLLPATLNGGTERGADVLAHSGYDCASGFDLSLVFLLTAALRIAGSLVLAYRHEAAPLYAAKLDVDAAVLGNAMDDDAQPEDPAVASQRRRR